MRSPPATRKALAVRRRALREPGGGELGWVTDDLLDELAGDVGLDWTQLKTDAASGRSRRQAQTTIRRGDRLGVPGTPWFFVKIGDGAPYAVQPSSFSIDAFRPILDDALAMSRQ